ncbi:MAG: hypothetical protein HY598_05085 [Candidatus Omnitrophica bacterium]|nr:hypothetical protein [Candidatus Omnitrophota bacterium]
MKPLPDFQHDQARRFAWWLVALGAVVYANSLSGAFLPDDWFALHDNPQVRHLPLLWDPEVAPHAEIALSGRPVPALLTALNYAVGGLNPLGYHVVNVAIHLMNALLLFGIIRRTLVTRREAAFSQQEAAALAAVSAALWMVHPLATEIAAERRMYLPLCALTTAAVVGAWRLLSRLMTPQRMRRRLAALAAVALVSAAAAGTVRRNDDYRTETALLQDTVAKRPRNSRARHNLGLALGRSGRLREAEMELRTVIRLRPSTDGPTTIWASSWKAWGGLMTRPMPTPKRSAGVLPPSKRT